LVALSAAELTQSFDERSLDVAAVSFVALYKAHFAFVWRNLRRLGVSESGLRDAAQDVFLVVHRRMSEFEGRGSLQAWLYSILRRVAADHRRLIRRKGLGDTDCADDIADTQDLDPEHRAVRGEALRALLRLLEGLDEDKRDALILVDLEGMTVPEVAVAVGSNVNTVYSRLRAARQQMQAAFEELEAEDWSIP
jgi:RNA polymerase sigma-70 factor, ECF subfamily